MAIFGNNVGGKITINGKEYKPLTCGCGNSSRWSSYTQSGNKEKAVCADCGATVER